VQRIGKYEVRGVLGRGGMGTVYKAEDPAIKRPVAVKMMRPELVRNPDLRTRFLREAQAAGALRHRNIVTVYDLGEHEGAPYIAMELIEGSDLDQIVRGGVGYSVEWRLDVMRQICDGLGAAHRTGIVHRDIKPANIRVTPDGEVKILDFGIVYLRSSRLTPGRMLPGTAHYMSPEQIDGRAVDQRSDVFSVGAIAYELLARRRRFEGESLPDVMFKVTHEGADPAGLPETAYSPALEAWVLRALAIDVQERFQSVEEMRSELERLVREVVPRTATPGQTARPPGHTSLEGHAELERARQEGQLQRARLLCEKLLAEEPQNDALLRAAREIESGIREREAEQLSGMALSYATDGDIDLAERIVARIERLTPQSERLGHLRAYVEVEKSRRTAEDLTASAREHLAQGNVIEAHAAAEEALAVKPAYRPADEILEQTARILKSREGDEVESLASAALGHFARNDNARALEAVQRVLALDPEHRKARQLQKILAALP
jgi:tRNA A-37 threonylcarbamoyl transferase component Bud32/tetratricopeptide (TPR) repeat protein